MSFLCCCEKINMQPQTLKTLTEDCRNYIGYDGGKKKKKLKLGASLLPPKASTIWRCTGCLKVKANSVVNSLVATSIRAVKS